MTVTLRMKNLRRQQSLLVDLVTFARDHGELRTDHDNVREFVDLFAQATAKQLALEKLERLTELTQQVLVLPVFTTFQAAAWLGITRDGLVDVLRRDNPPVKAMKPGHDVLIAYDELVRYAKER